MRRLILALLTTLALVALAPTPPGTSSAPVTRVTVIQAVPGEAVDVRIDDRAVATAAAVGDVLGPFELTPGRHDISFSGDGFSVDSELEVAAGASSDVVVHLPAEVGGDPVVHSYEAPTGAIGPGKARVMLAHTATVAPADVQVDGQIVFTNIANGEFAEADVPAGSIEVALLPSGTAGDPILGPLDLVLQAGTLSMVYAYGNPRDGSMNVIAHTAALAPDGTVRPSSIDTGSAGLARGTVTTFVDDSAYAAAPGTVGLLALAALAALLVVRRRRGPGSGPQPRA